MRLRLALRYCLGLSLLVASPFGTSAQTTFTLTQPVGSYAFGNVITDIQSTGSGDNRIFVVTRNGIIRIVKFTDCVGSVQSTPFLDIDSRVINCTGGCEMGLLGLAFHPEYASNGYFFVYYTNNDTSNGITRSVIARYKRSELNPDLADPTSEQILKIIDQPAQNHNGGQMQFGPDGWLYIALGDGGSSYDQAGARGQGQNLQTLLGKMLRVDVNDFTSSTWNIPPNNPYDSTTDSIPDEIWASGLRNPWRFSFDSLTGDMYIADVGQGAFEEVNIQPAASGGGENYGWCVCEANIQVSSSYSHCAAPGGFAGCSAAPFTPPAFQYPHSGGGSITGGYVYRGATYPAFQGTYFYADYVQRFVRGAQFDDVAGTWTIDALTTSSSMIGAATTFGESSSGEIYVGTYSGYLYQIKDPNVPDPPCVTEEPSAAPSGPTAVPSENPTRTPVVVTVSCPAEYQASKVIVDGMLVLDYSVVTSPLDSYAGILCARLVYQGSAWLGLGVSPDSTGGMVGSEAVIGTTDTVNGINGASNPNPGKYLLDGRLQDLITPISEGQTLIDASIVQDSTTTTLTFTKLLSEPFEIQIDGEGVNTFIWAVGASNSFSKHDIKGSFSLDFTPCSTRSDCVAEPSCEPIDCVNGFCQNDDTVPCGNAALSCSLPCSSCSDCSSNEASCSATAGCSFEINFPACAAGGNCGTCTTQTDCTDAGCNWRNNACKGKPSASSGGTCSGTASITCEAACVVTEIGTELSCNDGIDNDCDGFTDDADSDCPSTCIPTENPESTCNDGIDNDCDGAIDGADSDCQTGCVADGVTDSACTDNCQCISLNCRTNGKKRNTCA